MMAFISTLHAQDLTTPVERHGRLSVSGTSIVDKNGEVVSFAGNSMFWSNENYGAEQFYSRDVVEYLKDQWNSAMVRVALGVEDSGGYLTHPDENKTRLTTVVDAATELGLYVIIDWHSHTAEMHEQAAITFFGEMAEKYKNHENVIFEIYNEPLQVSWTDVVKPYAERVIDTIRNKGAENLIIVGSPNWSQDVDVAALHPIENRTNIAYTLHFYAGTHGANLRKKAQDAITAGLALFCTEWGTVDADGDGVVNRTSTNEWMEFFKTHNISHLNWSVHDKVEGASIFKAETNANNTLTDDDLTETGLFVKEIILGWGRGNGTAIIQAPWISHSSSANAEGLSFEYEILETGNNWFTANIVITNSGTTAIDGYTLGFTAPWSVQEFWNDVPGSESNDVFTVPVFNHAFLSRINVGSSVNIGFTGNGTWSEPTNITWNGEPLTSDNMSYEQWQATYSVEGKEEDDDVDGFSNLMEFFSGTIPNDAKSFPKITTSVRQLEAGQNSPNYFMMELLADTHATGVEYRLQVSNNLTGWSALDGEGGMELHETNELTDGMIKAIWKSVNPINTEEEPFFSRIELR